MKTQDLFFKTSSRKLNESLKKTFGTKINLESFSLTELEDARNKLRTQIHQWRSRSEFNENIENDTYHKAQWMLDAINAEILERDESIDDDEVVEYRQQFNSIENEDHGPEDPDADYNVGEYDREGDMSKDQLRTIDSAAEELYSVIDADENLPEWVQKKITLAMDYIDTARDYMKSNKYVENKETDMNTQETRLQESEVEQATAIVAAKDMVEKIGRYIEELSGMENETLIELGDKIRDEMGQEQARAFIESIAPAIQQALETLKATRETVSGGVRSLATGETPMDMLGAEPAAGGMDMPGDELGAAGPDSMNDEPMPEPGEGDDFGVAEPAAGGIEAPGRAQRESIQKSNLLKILAG